VKTKRILLHYMIKLVCPATNSSQPLRQGNASHRHISYERQVRHKTNLGSDHTFVSMADVAAGAEDRILPTSSCKLSGSGRI
jgi:hypothetical protein